MPSTASSSVLIVLASSTVITPSLPTFSIASAIIAPIDASPFDDTVPTWAMSSLPRTLRELLASCSTIAATAFSMPRFSAIGAAPAATSFRPPA